MSLEKIPLVDLIKEIKRRGFNVVVTLPKEKREFTKRNLQIRNLRIIGLTISTIARRLGISTSRVEKILRRKV